MSDASKIRVLIVDDIAETRDNLEKLLFFEKDIEVVGKASTGREAVALSKQLQPAVILMDINMPDMDGIAATEAILAQLPYVQIIMMSVQGETDYLRRAMLAGAREFLPKPISGDELCNAIRHVHRRYKEQYDRLSNFNSDPRRISEPGQPQQQGQIFAVFSPKGGVGTSVIAANLAVALRQLTNKKVALVDGNLSKGASGVIMNLTSNKTVVDIANRISELDRELLNDVLQTHTSQVKVLLSSPDPQTGDKVQAEHLKTILELMRREFDYIVVDTESSYHDRALLVLDSADRIVTLMTLEMTCIRNIGQFLEVAKLLEYPKEKLILVLNKADSRLGIRVENVEGTIQHKVGLQIANAAYEMAFSINQGVPLVIEKRTHQTSKDIFALASMLANSAAVKAPRPGEAVAVGAGKPQQPAQPQQQEKKSGLFGGLFTRR